MISVYLWKTQPLINLVDSHRPAINFQQISQRYLSQIVKLCIIYGKLYRAYLNQICLVKHQRVIREQARTSNKSQIWEHRSERVEARHRVDQHITRDLPEI